MKRILAALITGALLISTVQSSFGAVKAGATCTKLNQKKTVTAGTFQCKKISGKLKWKLIAQTPTPSITPTPTPISTSSTGYDTSDRLDYLLNLFADRKTSTINFQPATIIEYGKGTLPGYKNLIATGIPAAAKFWSSDIKENLSFPVIYAGLEDKDWFLSRIEYYGHSSPMYRENLERRIKADGDNVGLAGASDANGTFLMQFLQGKARTRLYPLDYGTVSHEYTHIVQRYFMDKKSGFLPCWAIEGGANVYANVIVGLFLNDQGGNKYLVRNGAVRISYESGQYDLWSANTAETIQLIKLTEPDNAIECTFPGKLGYSLGMLVSEALLIEFGHQKTLDWWKLSVSMHWKDAFKATFGINVDDWYRDKAAPYAIAEVSKIIKNWPPN
ncbi:MAG: hypothetical protein RL733_597 [Actinomycetota bacterium]|jgi:hypothetical protein